MIVVNVGRGPNNDVIIKDDRMVERCHVQFKKNDKGQYSVVDCQTETGTFVNGRRIRGQVRIKHGDRVQIGRTDLPWESYFPDEDKAAVGFGGWSVWSIVLLIVGGLAGVIITTLLVVNMAGIYHKKTAFVQIDSLEMVEYEEYENDSLVRRVLVENLLDSINNARSKGRKEPAKPVVGGGKDDGAEVVVEEVIIAAPVEQDSDEITDCPVFRVIERMPEFPGGDRALMSFLSTNVKYPVIAQENGIQGRVICQFTVDIDGSVTDVHIVKSAGDERLDKEAVRVVSSMPRWKPGMQREKPVKVRFTAPINFRLQ